MKNLIVLFSVVIIAIIITFSCNNKSDDPIPAERKKCAWVAGGQDSTGYATILFSADSGETWIRQGEGSTALQGVNLMDIWAVDENNVWAVGSNNSILRTNNGGEIWSQVQPPANIANNMLLSISIVNNTNIWISGGHGAIFNSTDNGTTWTMFDTTIFQGYGIQGNWALSPEKVYVVGGVGSRSERGFIGFTLDGGITWDSVVPANDYNKNEWIGVTAYENTIVVYGGSAHYMVSTDGGTTWKNDSVPGTGGGGRPADINHLIMLNPQIWWGACDEGQICHTTNGGTSWIIQQTGQGGFYLVGIDAWDSNLALAVGVGESWPVKGPLLKTSTSGILWERKLLSDSGLEKVTFIKK